MNPFRAFGPILNKKFFESATVRTAKALLGTVLVRTLSGPDGKPIILAGRIVETEAYLPELDPSCHAARGRTPRNDPMFGPPGTAYVYFIYGNYFCLNVVTEPRGVPGAVLIRALEPLQGMDFMRLRRAKDKIEELANGPGKLCQAMDITRELNRAPFFSGPLVLRRGESTPMKNIITAPRIGIKQGAELPLRFYVKDSNFVSRK